MCAEAEVREPVAAAAGGAARGREQWVGGQVGAGTGVAGGGGRDDVRGAAWIGSTKALPPGDHSPARARSRGDHQALSQAATKRLFTLQSIVFNSKPLTSCVFVLMWFCLKLWCNKIILLFLRYFS